VSLQVNQVYNMDCLEGMKEIEAGSVNLVLSDLPYGITQNVWDSVIDLRLLWAEYKRVMQPNGAVVLTASQPFTAQVVMSNPQWFKYAWVWEKNVATGHLNANRCPMKKHEDILVFAQGQPMYHPQMQPGKPYKMKRKPINDNGSNYGNITRTDTINEGLRFPVSIIQFDRETGLHPTQKPVALFEYLIRTYTNPGDLVLDNCMGSGTTAIACINTGRNFIGFETDPKYYQICLDRIATARGEQKAA
jgi:site-specific DNA-methyltransferase (adenine-specific)